MIRLGSMILLAGLAISCRQQDNSAPESKPSHFFSSSKRRDAGSAERQMVAKVGGCAAFFLESSSKGIYMASARHCFKKSITTWCNGGGAIVGNNGEAGRCKRIIAADYGHDIAVFEADFGSVRPAMTALKLSTGAPAAGTPLKMIGYPGDPWRKGALTVTESCTAEGRVYRSPHRDLLDLSMRHNCSTYGGNSGGPMLRAGTNEVIGLPFTYRKLGSATGYDVKHPYAFEGSLAYLALMSDFVGKNAAALAAAGISMTATPYQEVSALDAAPEDDEQSFLGDTMEANAGE